MSDTQTSAPETKPSSTAKLVSASALMAAGTLTSRVLGFGRLMLLVLLFGNGTRQADMFTFANTVPNSMYILLAGGVLNTVLVPQIVRAIKGDPDGGEAYTNRIMTAGLLILGAITVALTFAAPLIIGVYTPDSWHTPGRAAQYDSMVMLAYYCLPQIFFYGVHVLAGQVLNARDRFGPMMWAPIANNVISILVLVIFLVVFGQGDTVSAFTPGQEMLLGLGSTVGIAAQAAVLVPFLRSAGYRFRPRFDFRGVGLGHTFALAKWTLGFVLVTQAALVVIYRLAGGATAGGRGAGLTVYSNAYAIWILPHSLITLSLATVMLPTASRLAAAGDLAGVRDETMRTMRLAVTALLPTAVALIALGPTIAQLAFGFGQGAADAHLVGWALMALALGLVPFTVQYVCLRAYYSLEDTRTTFFLQLVISGCHVVLAVLIVSLLRDPALVATGLGLAYAGAYTLGVVLSFRILGRRLPGLSGGQLLRHCLKLLLAVLPSGLLAYALATAFSSWSDSRVVLVLTLVAAGAVAVPAFLLMARLLHIGEVGDILDTFLHRRRPARAGGHDVGDTTPADAGDPGSPGDSGPLGDSGTGNRWESPTIVAAQNATPSSSPLSPGGPGGPMETQSMVSQPGATQTPLDPPVELEPTPIAAVMPAGTVLARRYRLEELLADSRATVTWRAFDQVLSRSVLVHLLPPRDPAAADLLNAARQASVATDSRFLRVLDAVYSDHADLGSYIVCEYATGQSLELILSQGPLSGLEAAWVVREVADALSGAHAAGLYHQRISPDTVIITPTGNVKIVGLLIEAALKPTATTAVVHGADTPELVDVLDLGRLLYAALVARWPGGPGYGLADAPLLGHRWMTPRQVRAGVSPALDTVCDQILGEPPRHRAAALRTADDVVNALTKVLGTADASGDLERRLRQPVPRVGTPAAAPVSSLLDTTGAGQDQLGSQQTVAIDPRELEQRTEQMARVDLPWGPKPSNAPGHEPLTPDSAPVGAAPNAGRSPVSALAGLGPEAAVTTRVRQPPPPTGPTRSSRPRSSSPAGAPASRPRRWLGLLLLLVVGVVVAGLVSLVVFYNRTPTAGPGDPTTSASTPPPSAQAARIAIQGARDFDPQADPPSENPQLVENAFDGSAKTRWQTVTYFRNPKLGGLKRGVGLVLDLGEPQPVSSVRVSLSGSGTAIQLRVPEDDPEQVSTPPMTSDGDWRTVAKKAKAGKTANLEAETVTTRFVLLYLTSLPKEGSGYRGGIYEVEVFS